MGTTSFVTTAITNMLAEVIRTNCQGEKNSKAYATNIIQVTFKDLSKNSPITIKSRTKSTGYKAKE